MTITLNVHHIIYGVAVILMAIPFVYDSKRGHGGDYDFHLDSALIFVGCWGFAIALLIGKFIGGLLK